MPNDIPDWTQEANVVVSSGTITVNSISTPVSIATGTIDISTASIAVANVSGTNLNIQPVPISLATLGGTYSFSGTGTVNQTVGTISVPAVAKIVYLSLSAGVNTASTGGGSLSVAMILTDGTHSVTLLGIAGLGTVVSGTTSQYFTQPWIPSVLATSGTWTLRLTATGVGGQATDCSAVVNFSYYQ